MSTAAAGTRNKNFITAAALKRIAAVTMLIDHIGAFLIGTRNIFPGTQSGALFCFYTACRVIGRISFPIFAFLLAEGFYHTRNPKKYLLRVWIFALISEIPYNLCMSGTWTDPLHQNILFSFGLSLFLLQGLDILEKRKDGIYRFISVKILYEILLTAAAAFFSEALHFDYGWETPVLVSFFFLFRYRIPFFTCLEKGKGNKMFYYWLYPGHLFLLWLIGHFFLRG